MSILDVSRRGGNSGAEMYFRRGAASSWNTGPTRPSGRGDGRATLLTVCETVGAGLAGARNRRGPRRGPPYPRNPPVLLGGVHSAGRVRFISMPISPWRRSLRALEVKTGNSFRERKRREARWASRGRCACLQVLDARKNGSGDTHPVITISNVVISAESFL